MEHDSRIRRAFGLSPGNHDYLSETPSNRDTTTFDAQAGYARMHTETSYGGYWTGDPGGFKANQYLRFNAGGRNILVLFLELFPRGNAVTWAEGIINANPHSEVYIVTHAYINGDGDTSFPPTNLITSSYTYGPASYGLADAPANYSGKNLGIWALQFPNLRLIVCGHNATYVRITQTGTHGNTFYGLLTNYQSATPSSQVILLIQFTPTSITVNNLNTTTGLIDHTTFPPEVLPLPPVR